MLLAAITISIRHCTITSADSQSGGARACAVDYTACYTVAQAYRVNHYDANVQLRCTAELTVLSAQCTVCIGLEY